MFDDLRHLGLTPSSASRCRPAVRTRRGRSSTPWVRSRTGQADVVACTYAAAPTGGLPRRADGSTGGCWRLRLRLPGAARPDRRRGCPCAPRPPPHAPLHGTTSEHLGAVAVTNRSHAVDRVPSTIGFGQPITLEDHQAPRMIKSIRCALLDAAATPTAASPVIVTTMERGDHDSPCAPTPRHPRRRQRAPGCGRGGRATWDLHDDVGRRKATAFGQAGHHRRRHRHRPALRPVHDLGDHAARGLRLHPAGPGEGGAVRGSGAPRRRADPDEHRRRPALRLLLHGLHGDQARRSCSCAARAAPRRWTAPRSHW